jgi:hypothetical protein
MFIRFCSTAIDRDSGQPRGVFMEANALYNSGRLATAERHHLRAMLNWFSEHIPEPPKNIQQSSAIFWFKSGAQENVQHIQRLIRLLRAHGSHIVAQQCETLDNIVYEDDYQVAVGTSECKPGSDT